MSYERLMREHALIEVAVTRLLALVSVDAADVEGVVIALSDLSRELTAHLAHEDSCIYPRMIGGQNALLRESASAFAAQFASLRADCSAYLSAWDRESIAADWKHFRDETFSILDRLQRRVEAENTILYTAALRENVVALREQYEA